MTPNTEGPWPPEAPEPPPLLDGITVPEAPDDEALPWADESPAWPESKAPTWRPEDTWAPSEAAAWPSQAAETWPQAEAATDLPWSEAAMNTADLALPQAPPANGTADQLAAARQEAHEEQARWRAEQAKLVDQALLRAQRPGPEEERVFWVSTWLSFLSFLFLARVLGQLVVLLAEPTWLPPMVEWYSGLLPYPLLLPCQVAILAFMAWANWRTLSADPEWWRPKAKLALGLAVFAALYAGGMLARYVISGHLHPERRFLPPGIIPILFHFVLAGYVAGLAWVFSKREAKLW